MGVISTEIDIKLTISLDIDECSNNLDNCAVGIATCTNNEGSYSCACKPGYTGDGVTCTGMSVQTKSQHFITQNKVNIKSGQIQCLTNQI